MRPGQFKYCSGSMVFPWPRDSALLQNSKFHAAALAISSLKCQRGVEAEVHLLCPAVTKLPIATPAALEAAALQLSRLVHERPGKSLSEAHLKPLNDVKGF